MQTLILHAGITTGSTPPTPSAEDLATVLHGGPVRVWFGPALTRQLTAADFNSEGIPDSTLGFEELAEITGKPQVSYKQEQQKRKSQGRTLPSQTNVTGEEFTISNLEFLSIHGTAGSRIRDYLSGGFTIGGVVGGSHGSTFEPFGLIFVSQNFTDHAADQDFLVGVILSATADGWSFGLADDDFSIVSATISAEYGENESAGVAQCFSLAA